MIAVTDLHKVYQQAENRITALDGVTLRVPRGHVHGVIGASGAGKSTLVRCLAMLERPSAGTVEINGTELTAVPPAALRKARRRLGVAFQHANLFDSRTVAGNVSYPLELAKVNRTQRQAKTAELLELVGLAGARNAYPAQLSGGQRQRVGIARALATDPDVLLCDEPTSALDPATTAEILDLIAALRERLGLAVLVITHEMGVVKRICDSVSLLEAGRLVESGSLAEVVGRFGSRLSEALIGPPPNRLATSPTVELLEQLSSTRPGAIETAADRLGVTVPVVAATVEELAGITFRRARVGVPASLTPLQVIAALQHGGAQARPNVELLLADTETTAPSVQPSDAVSADAVPADAVPADAVPSPAAPADEAVSA